MNAQAGEALGRDAQRLDAQHEHAVGRKADAPSWLSRLFRRRKPSLSQRLLAVHIGSAGSTGALSS